ncbi:hypothetical protein AX16_008793 [Volvariella volvacea WC 439]|nr:hypothetical protein AX16_008793 [Volvariella volvacea WC 439]
MPPPTANDAWLAGRHFGIVIDAGSSGSRLQIYSWRDPRTIQVERGSPLSYTLPKVEKGTQTSEDWVYKVEPGISSFAENPAGVANYLHPLIDHARNHVPPSLQHETPIFLLATAGMRLLTPEQQAEILQNTCRYLVQHSNFKVDGPSEVGPCGTSVRIITGEEEGLFGWIAVNYLMDGFAGSSAEQNRTTYGFLDMGGASTQIAFEPNEEYTSDVKNKNNLIDVRLRLLGGDEVHHKVFVTTWLGYGTNKARERYVGYAIEEFERSNAGSAEGMVPDPCLPKDLELAEASLHVNAANSHSNRVHHLVGTGSFEQCMRNASVLLNKSAPCPDSPCLMSGVHVPPIDFSVSHFIGISEYWYSSEHVFGLGGAYNFIQYERAASAFCARDWEDIMKQHERDRDHHRLGGDGELVQDGKVVKTGVWGPNVERSRLEMQCFKAAWIVNVLHEGLGLPRIVDPGGNVTTNGDEVEAQAKKKGLGKPTFQSMDTINDIAITWTLGKMVLEASKEVPPANQAARPIVDPVDDIPDLAHSPVHPIRPPFINLDDLEDRITPHLPVVLTRSSLGFSPVLLLLALSLCFIFLVVVYPLRRHIRMVFLRTVRKAGKREQEYLMEEGLGGNGSRPDSPIVTSSMHWLAPIRRVFSSPKSNSQQQSKPPLSIIAPNNPNLRHMNINSNKVSSPTRPFSTPNGNGYTVPAVVTSSISRSPSPAPSSFMEDSNLSSFSRSRNGSSMSLSSMVPRPKALSRANSTHMDEDE